MQYYFLTQGIHRGLIIPEHIYEETLRTGRNYLQFNGRDIQKLMIDYYSITINKANMHNIISCHASDGQLRSKTAKDDYIIAAKLSGIDPTSEEIYTDNTARLFVLLRSGETLSVSTAYPFYNVILNNIDIFNGKLRFKTDYKNHTLSSDQIRNLIKNRTSELLSS